MKRHLSKASRIALTFSIVVAAALVSRGLWSYYLDEPWTRDAHVRADVVKVATDVSGLVQEVLVHDNSVVARGDVLFRVDRQRFIIALQQAQAALAAHQAARDQAKRELARSQSLGDFVSRQRIEQAETALAQAEASYQQSIADKDLATLNLARSEVRAPVGGTISNLALQPGDYVTAGSSVMALINGESLRVEGYFEETKLPKIHFGDRAEIRLMGQSKVIRGTVESIAGGIEDRERTGSSGFLANINPTFNWVRLAQRIPVRIKLDPLSPEIKLVAGLTATVQIGESKSLADLLFREP